MIDTRAAVLISMSWIAHWIIKESIPIYWDLRLGITNMYPNATANFDTKDFIIGVLLHYVNGGTFIWLRVCSWNFLSELFGEDVLYEIPDDILENKDGNL